MSTSGWSINPRVKQNDKHKRLLTRFMTLVNRNILYDMYIYEFKWMWDFNHCQQLPGSSAEWFPWLHTARATVAIASVTNNGCSSALFRRESWAVGHTTESFYLTSQLEPKPGSPLSCCSGTLLGNINRWSASWGRAHTHSPITERGAFKIYTVRGETRRFKHMLYDKFIYLFGSHKQRKRALLF